MDQRPRWSGEPHPVSLDHRPVSTRSRHSEGPTMIKFADSTLAGNDRPSFHHASVCAAPENASPRSTPTPESSSDAPNKLETPCLIMCFFDGTA